MIGDKTPSYRDVEGWKLVAHVAPWENQHRSLNMADRARLQHKIERRNRVQEHERKGRPSRHWEAVPHEGVLTPLHTNYRSTPDHIHALRHHNVHINALERLADQDRGDDFMRRFVDYAGVGNLAKASLMGATYVASGGVAMGLSSAFGSLVQHGFDLKKLRDRRLEAEAMVHVYDHLPRHTWLHLPTGDLYTPNEGTEVGDEFVETVSEYEEHLGINVPNQYEFWIKNTELLAVKLHDLELKQSTATHMARETLHMLAMDAIGKATQVVEWEQYRKRRGSIDNARVGRLLSYVGGGDPGLL